MKYRGVIRLNMGRFDTNEAVIESGGLVNSSHSTNANKSDNTVPKLSGAGGSHGGQGGNYNKSYLGILFHTCY